MIAATVVVVVRKLCMMIGAITIGIDIVGEI